jgi:hypothetical protein
LHRRRSTITVRRRRRDITGGLPIIVITEAEDKSSDRAKKGMHPIEKGASLLI